MLLTVLGDTCATPRIVTIRREETLGGTDPQPGARLALPRHLLLLPELHLPWGPSIVGVHVVVPQDVVLTVSLVHNIGCSLSDRRWGLVPRWRLWPGTRVRRLPHVADPVVVGICKFQHSPAGGKENWGGEGIAIQQRNDVIAGL